MTSPHVITTPLVQRGVEMPPEGFEATPTNAPRVSLMGSRLWCQKYLGAGRQTVVARAGFEPAIPGLKGRCPSPLDDRAEPARNCSYSRLPALPRIPCGLPPLLSDTVLTPWRNELLVEGTGLRRPEFQVDVMGDDGGAMERTLYDRLGGIEAITAVVESFRDRVAADDRINLKFARTDLARLRKMLIDQVCEATGGPCHYNG